ncbi:phosphate acetyltransferase [Candidatus Erwinia haradaeae]|uniref:Phosphate acetyltransferase n=1 Tax=Candidatus Erwinia haradaeae TaxID=1922217 RepID=A0A451D1T4_9GAMM|nr:phosphate acetyltransferase [Candidatus Erwinia haradaeae]VFP79562.1 Phosphate acetyltransferase [Candidatus Erwinia haradaeae]
MKRAIIFIPTDAYINIMNILYGIKLSAKNSGIHFSLFTPISSVLDNNTKKNPLENTKNNVLNMITSVSTIHETRWKALLKSGQMETLMEEIISNYNHHTSEDEITLIAGVSITNNNPCAYRLNHEIAHTLNAEIVFVYTMCNESLSQVQEHIALTYASLLDKMHISGMIINHINYLIKDESNFYPKILNFLKSSDPQHLSNIDIKKLNTNSKLPILGYIPWNLELMELYSMDLFHYLNATIINEGNIRRITSITFCPENIIKMVKNLNKGSLLIISSWRIDLLVAACLAETGDVKISGILLMDDNPIDITIVHLCKISFQSDLPIFQVTTNSLETAQNLQRFILKKSTDNTQNHHKIHTHISHHISTQWITSLQKKCKKRNYLSPTAFKYQLTQLSRQAGKHIILPEGDEPRIIQAAAVATEKGIATCILLGNPKKIQHIASNLGITLNSYIQILDPLDVRKKYINRLVKIRKDKGMTTDIAQKKLEENIVLGTMILESGKVDGLVSGITNTTANTIRPALQLIKTAPNNSLISSVFFMLLPDQVLVYGDCAINPNPNSKELAEIAIQSADSARAFGIEPRIAMISYSTGQSGAGKDVDKVREATLLAQEKRPDLLIDGPLQYDAAIMMDVAKSKAPNSRVAGHATVFIFPDLNTGNTTYKAVQRAAKINSIGPMLQGMRKPVNDLSRGALVSDIVYTIALTAIQSLTLK